MPEIRLPEPKFAFVELGSWAVKNWPTVCVGQHKTTAKLAKNNCRPSKRQLPKYQKTTAKRSKNNCRTSKNCRRIGQLGSWNFTYCMRRAAQNNCRTSKKQLPSQQKMIADPAKNNCRNIKKQLPNDQKITAEPAKNNWRRVGQIGNWNLTYCVRRAAQNNCRARKVTADQAKNNCRNIKKRLPNDQKTTAE